MSLGTTQQILNWAPIATLSVNDPFPAILLKKIQLNWLQKSLCSLCGHEWNKHHGICNGFIVYYRVVDPIRAVTGVRDVDEMTNLHIMSSIYKILAQINLAKIVWQSSEVGRIIKRVVNQETLKWGVLVQNVELARVDIIHGQIVLGTANPATLDEDWT